MNIICLSQSVTPITHQLGVVGNESIVNTEDVRTPLGNRKIAKLSGNAIRHRMLRAPSAEYLEVALDLRGKLNRDTLNLLYHGGLKREKAKSPSLAKIANMQRLFPVFRLLGCCLPEAITSGDLVAYIAMLVCRENAWRFPAIIPNDWMEGIKPLAPSTSFVERWQYVRGKMTHAKANEATDNDDADDSKMMPFAGTCVIPGSLWLHGFHVESKSTLDLGFVLHSLRRWDASGASIGGQSSRGHGVLQLSYCHDMDVDDDAAVAEYESHVADNADECRKFLLECYK